MTNPKIETGLSEILLQINGKLDKISIDVTELKIGQVRFESKLESLETRLETLSKEVTGIKTTELSEIKSTQKTLVNDVASLKGAKSLITPIIVAVTVSILTLVIRSIPIS